MSENITSLWVQVFEVDINLIMSYLLPILLNEGDIETTVVKTGNQFVLFRFGKVQFLDVLNSLRSTTNLDSVLKLYRIAKIENLFPIERFNYPDKLNNKELPPYGFFTTN